MESRWEHGEVIKVLIGGRMEETNGEMSFLEAILIKQKKSMEVELKEMIDPNLSYKIPLLK